jgi:uncharacterized protein
MSSYPQIPSNSLESSIPASSSNGDGGQRPRTLRRSDLPRWPFWAPFVAAIMAFVVANVAQLILVLIKGVVDHNFSSKAVAKAASSPGILIGGTVIQDAALIFAAILIATLTFGRPTPRQFGLRSTRVWAAIGWILLSAFAFYTLSAVYASLVDIPKSELPKQLGANSSVVATIAFCALITIVAPIAEEFFFRGYLFPSLWRFMGFAPAVIVTGLFFGSVHAINNAAVALVPLALLGAVLCLLYAKTRSIIPGMMLHSLNNVLAFGVYEKWLTSKSISWELPVVALGSVAVILLIVMPFVKSRRLNMQTQQVASL